MMNFPLIISDWNAYIHISLASMLRLVEKCDTVYVYIYIYNVINFCGFLLYQADTSILSQYYTILIQFVTL